MLPMAGRRAASSSVLESQGGKFSDTFCEPSNDCKNFEVYSETFQRVTKFDSSARWWIGDLLNYGERIHGEMYTQVETLTKISPETLIRYKHVSLRVAPERRYPTDVLHWGHHAEVAKLTPDEQSKWLERAVKEGWTIAELKDALRKKGRREANKDDDKAVEMCACCHAAEPVAEVCETCLGVASNAREGLKKVSKPHVELFAWALEHIDGVDFDGPDRAKYDQIMKIVRPKKDDSPLVEAA